MSSGSFCLFLLVLVCVEGLSAHAQFEENDPYENLIVEIKPDLPQCYKALDTLKKILYLAHYTLHYTTGNLSFKNVTFVLPKEMEVECGAYNVIELSEVPDVQRLTIGDVHPVFGPNPWTQQTRGCGKPGDILYLPSSYIFSYIPCIECRLLQEWAKYRWGVFEEFGLENDPIFPLEFVQNFSVENGVEWRPNYCVDQPLLGFANGQCQHPNCPFDFDKYQNASSSMLALSSVISINNFCKASNHMNYIPTKQNARCNGQSFREVFNKHPDSKHRPIVPPHIMNIRYAIVRNDTARKYVILVDQSDVMLSTIMQNRWTMVTSAMSQWILDDIVTHSVLGVALFNSSVQLIQNLTLIEDDTQRTDISSAIPTEALGGTTKSISNALTYVTQNMGLDKGTILLIVDPNKVSTSDTLAKMVTAAGSNAVWPLLFPVANGQEPERVPDFQQVASQTGGEMLMVENESYYDPPSTSKQSIQIQRNLVQHLRRAQKQVLLRSPLSTPVLNSEQQITTSQSSFELLVGSNVDPEQPMEIVVYSHTPPYDILVDGLHVDISNITPTSFKAALPSLDISTHTVNITFNSNTEPNLVEFLAMEGEESLTASFWSSHDLSYVSLDNSNDPVTLFVKVTRGNLPVVGAEVSLLISDSTNSDTLQLRDNGGGPDITGNDGIYTSFWLLSPGGAKRTYNIYLRVKSTEDSYAIGKIQTDSGIVCCGSSLDLTVIPKTSDKFSVEMKVGTSYVVSDPANTDYFPPVKVTDLRSFLDYRGVNLNFTAPGDDLDRGFAFEYRVWWRPSSEVDWEQITSTEYTVVRGGLEANVVFPPPVYDQLMEVTVTALDTRLQESQRSNLVRLVYPSNFNPVQPHPTQSCPSCTGGIVGAFFGGMALAFILVVLGYFVDKKFHLRKTKRRPSPPPQSRPTVSNAPTPSSTSAGSHTNRGFNDVELRNQSPENRRPTEGDSRVTISSPIDGTVVVPSSGEATVYPNS